MDTNSAHEEDRRQNRLRCRRERDRQRQAEETAEQREVRLSRRRERDRARRQQLRDSATHAERQARLEPRQRRIASGRSYDKK